MAYFEEATTQVQDISDFTAAISRSLRFAIPMDFTVGPSQVRLRGTAKPFIDGLNRDSVKKLNAKQIAICLDMFHLLGYLHSQQVKTFRGALRMLLPLISLEEEDIYEIATTLICDQFPGSATTSLDESSDFLRIVVAPYPHEAKMMFDALHQARPV